MKFDLQKIFWFRWGFSIIVSALVAALYFIPGTLHPRFEIIPISFSPLLDYAKEILAGQLNFWNHYFSLGTPWPLPQSQTNSPFWLLSSLLSPLKVAGVAVFFQTIFATWSLLKLCEWVKLEKIMSAVVVLTVLSSGIFEFILISDAPNVYITWSYLPFTILAVLKIHSCENKNDLMIWSLALGIVSGLMVLNGHMGLVPGYALIIASIAIWTVWGNLGKLKYYLIALIVATFLSIGKLVFLFDELQLIYGDIERLRGGVEFGSEFIWHSFFRPIVWPFENGQFSLEYSFNTLKELYRTPRYPSLGLVFGIFFFVSVSGCFFRNKLFYTRNYILVWGALLSILMLVPPSSLTPNWLSSTLVFRDTLVIFGSLLAASWLQGWAKNGARKKISNGLILAQTLQVLIGTSPFILGTTMFPHPSYWTGQEFEGLQENFNNSFPDIVVDENTPTRVLQSQNLFELSEADILVDLGIDVNSMRLVGAADVSALLKGVSLDSIAPSKSVFYGQVRDLSENANSFLNDVTMTKLLGVEYILSLGDEEFTNPEFELLSTIKGKHGYEVNLFGRSEPAAKAFVIESLSTAPNLRAYCKYESFVCHNYSDITLKPEDVAVTFLPDEIKVSLRALEKQSVIIVSSMYRDDWKVQGENKASVKVSSWNGLLALEIPSGTTEVKLKYEPTLLIWLFWLKAFTFAAASIYMGLLIYKDKRRRISFI